MGIRGTCVDLTILERGLAKVRKLLANGELNAAQTQMAATLVDVTAVDTTLQAATDLSDLSDDASLA